MMAKHICIPDLYNMKYSNIMGTFFVACSLQISAKTLYDDALKMINQSSAVMKNILLSGG
jgi:hypothetical protein